MKLYTDEQVIEAIIRAKVSNEYAEEIVKNILSDLTPIELPSEEVIRGQLECTESEDYIAGKCTGMFFVINHIKQQNNDKN